MTSRQGHDAAIVRALEQHGALDDDQMGNIIGTSRQSARSAALRMQEAGVVTRAKPAAGKWVSSLAGASAAPGATEHDPPQAPPPIVFDAPAAAGALAVIQAFTLGRPARTRVSALERVLVGATGEQVADMLRRELVTDSVLRAALLVKSLTGEINVLIHALGILLSLPYILVPGEEVLTASLGAGTGGRPYDLVTTHRVAEFKFTRWRGHDAVRQRELFADFVNLAEDDSGKRRVLYVTGGQPERFLMTSRRQLASVCERRPEIAERITRLYGDQFRTVRDYTSERRHRVEIVDLEATLPAYITVDLA